MSKKTKTPDLLIFLVVIGLLFIGITMVFSSSAVKAYSENHDSLYYLKRQFGYGMLGMGALFFMMRFDYRRLRALAKPMFIGSLILLVAVLIPGIGKVINGARRWIEIGVQFQPSEIAKLTTIIFLADWLATKPEKNKKFMQGLLPAMSILALIFLLIYSEPDLGTSLIIFGTGMLMIFAGGANWKCLVSLIPAGLVAVGMMILMEPYRARRLFAFLDPWKDPLNTGFHVVQSLMALGSGGIFGLGLGRSRQKFFYLPEQHTDFIFAILGEELGFIGGAAVLILFLLLAWRGYRTAVLAPDMFGSLLAVGVTSLIILQAVINIGVVTSSIPVTGLTLPFISYGGTSLIFLLGGVGILLNISRAIERR